MGLSLSDWSDIAQIVATAVAAAGVCISVFIATRTLRELKNDRQLRHLPYLAFQPGGYGLGISFETINHCIPGINPSYLEKIFAHLPKDKESVVLSEKVEDGERKFRRFSELRNYGSGPAIGTQVTWVPESIWINNEKFAITPEKLANPLYGARLNRIPSVPNHIEPGKHAELTRLPSFIVKDYDRKITQVDGYLLITCSDIFGETHITKQTFHLFTHYEETPACVHITFSDHMRLAN